MGSFDSAQQRTGGPNALGANPRDSSRPKWEAERSEAVAVTGPSARFGRSLAVVIGIDMYSEGIAPLRSAVADAKAIAATLQRDHAFETWCLFDGDALLPQLLTLLREKLPSTLGANDRLLFYFAGHGVALDSDAGPAGYLVPADAQRWDRDSFLPMRVVHAELARLSVRHVFVILDCCFAGAFRWAHTRDVGCNEVIYRERYDRYLESPAWQVLASASSHQRAFDVLANDRDDGTGPHSPFALALLAGLAGAADYTEDNVITADELAMYVREHMAQAAESVGSRQVPQLFPLERHDCGQFIFQVSNRPLALAPAPLLDENMNPYRGLESFREEDRTLFFGRDELIEQLVEAVGTRRLTVVVGPSGSGKSSLVQAGLVPLLLRSKGWTVLPTQRPGREPLAALNAWTRALGATPTPGDPVASWTAAIAECARARPEHSWLVIVDQFEELLTHRTAEHDRIAFLDALSGALLAAPNLHLVVTVRSDAEPQFHDTALAPRWTTGRFPVPAMTRDELRQAIERPATTAVLHFEPSRLVERLLDDVALVPAPLPLLSFALSELYRCCWARWQRGVRDRGLHETDYAEMGSVARALTQRATTVHDGLVADDAAYASTIRNVFTRMVSVVGGEVARRRVPRNELTYEDPAENERIAEVLQRFHDARLISLGRDESGGTASAYAEPTHDELVRGWTKVSQWLDDLDAGVGMRALASLGDAVRSWNHHGRVDVYLWNDPRLELLYERARARPCILNADESRFVERSARRRRRRRVQLVGGLLGAVVVLAIFGLVAWRQKNEAERNAKIVQERLAGSDMEQGRALLLDGHPMRALPYLLAARVEGIDDSAVLRMLFARASGDVPQLILEHRDKLWGAAFSPDGARVVTASWDHTAQIWDARTGERVTAPLQHDDQVWAAAFSPDGARVVTASGDHTARIWDARTGEPVTAALQHADKVVAATFSPDSTRVVTASWDHTAQIWDARTGERVTAPLQHDDQVWAAAFSPDGARVVTASGDHTARIWDARTGERVTAPLVHRLGLTAAAFSPDGARVVTASFDGTARVWDAATGKPVTDPLVHREVVRAAAFSPDGTRVVTASEDHTAQVWDAATGKPVTDPLEHRDHVWVASFSGDGARVVTASEDHTARVWDAATGKPVIDPLEHRNKVMGAAFSPDGARVVTASLDGTARVWDTRTSKPVTESFEYRDTVKPVAFSSDGTRMVTASLDGTARVWDARTGKPVTDPLEHRAAVRAAAFSPDGTRVVTASDDRTARVWDARTGKPVTDPLEHRAAVRAAAFSPDGTRVVTASDDRTARVWDARTGKPVTEPLEHSDAVHEATFSPDGARVVTGSDTARVWDARTGKPVTGPPLDDTGPPDHTVTAVAFSPDGARVVTGRADGIVRVWDVRTSKPVTDPLKHSDTVHAAAFSPDGMRVVTASEDHTARVWDARTGKPITEPLEHSDAVYAAAFSPDGTRVVTGSKDKTVRVWDARTGKLATEPLEHHSSITAAAFSADGARVITRSEDGAARVWALPMDLGSLDDWRRGARCGPFALESGALVENRSRCP